MADKELSRLDFFKEIKKDITDAAKEFIIPVIKDDIHKLDDVVEEVIGVEWFYLNIVELEEETQFTDVRDYYINNQHVSIFYNWDKLQAVEKSCSNCGGILNWISYDKRFKCFSCENEYEIYTEKENPSLKYFTIKQKDDRWVIGLYKLQR